MNRREVTFYVETLGCPRNESDSEFIINELLKSGYCYSSEPEKSDIIILNGCSFIQEAVSDSIDRILELHSINEDAFFVVAGCLAQRYGYKLMEAMPEIDLLVGTGSIYKIGTLIKDEKSEIESCRGFVGKNVYPESRVIPSHYRYIKIQEGCDYNCSFCIIPELKGRSHSKIPGDIEEQITGLSDEVKEVVLIGQNTSSWGKDLNGDYSLSYLLKIVEDLFYGWIRVLYLHPLSITEELLETINESKNIINYLDIPLQHVSDRVLKSMKRGYNRKEIERLLDLIVEKGDFTVRTTLIYGYPDEKDDDFEELCDFIEEKPLDYVGYFEYSREESADSYNLGTLPDAVLRERSEIISRIAGKKMRESNRKYYGKKVKILVDGKFGERYYGRTRFQAPEIDPVVLIEGEGEFSAGEFCRVKITDTLEGEMIGGVI